MACISGNHITVRITASAPLCKTESTMLNKPSRLAQTYKETVGTLTFCAIDASTSVVTLPQQHPPKISKKVHLPLRSWPQKSVLNNSSVDFRGWCRAAGEASGNKSNADLKNRPFAGFSIPRWSCVQSQDIDEDCTAEEHHDCMLR